jgi:hypothetical protein
VLIDSLLVESIDFRRLGEAACGDNVLRDCCDGCPVKPGEKDLGPFVCKGASDSTADPASGSVSHDRPGVCQ